MLLFAKRKERKKKKVINLTAQRNTWDRKHIAKVIFQEGNFGVRYKG